MDTQIKNIVVGWVEDELRDKKCPFCLCYRYPKDYISRDRLVKSCIKCRASAKKSSDKNKEKRREYYLNNRDKLIQYQKDYMNENVDFKNYQKKYYQEHKQYLIELNKTYYDSNKSEYPLHTKIIRMIYGAKDTDKKKRGLTEFGEDYIDMYYIHELFVKQQGLCWYSNCEARLDYISFNHYNRNDNLITLQRLNDELPHTKDNCVLSCFRCNVIQRRQMN